MKAAIRSFLGGLFKGKSSGSGTGWEQMFSGAGNTTELTQPYAQSAWVHAAIKYVTGPLASVPLVWTRDARGGDVMIDDAELTQFWETPAMTLGGPLARQEFIEALVGWLLLRGEAFIVLDDEWLGGRRLKVTRPMVARPDRLQPIYGPDRTLAGWTYADGSKTAYNLLPEQVIQIKRWNPYNDYRGLGDYNAARIASESDFAGGVFARNLMLNNGDRGPYVIGKDGGASPEQIEQITMLLRQKREMSRRGDFRPVFLTGDITVEEPALQAADAAFVAQRAANAVEVFIAFGVPPSYTTVTASYSTGSASDRLKLIEETCMPIGAKICDALERVEKLRSGNAVFAEFDWSKNSTMQQVRRECFESATKAVDRGMPWRQASQYFALAMPRFPGDDIGRVPFSLVELDADGHEAKPDSSGGGSNSSNNDGTNANEADPVEELEKIFARRNATLQTARSGAAEVTPTPAPDPEREALWRKIHKSREPWEKKMTSTVSRLLWQARGQMLAKLAALNGGGAGKAAVVAKAADPDSLMWDFGDWLADWVKSLSQVHRSALETAGQELWRDELGHDDPLTLPSGDVLAAVTARQNKIRGAGEKVFADIKQQVSKAIAEGQTNAELEQTIKTAFKGISDSRAATIGATEITHAYETGRDMTFKAAGVEWTQWLSARDGRERHTHHIADGQIREQGVAFEVGGYELAYPGDPDGPAKEVINCRCCRIAVQGPDQGDIEGNNNDDIPY